MSNARALVDKLWAYCNVLRDDGVSTIDYTEQLTYLLFLKMAHEREMRPLKPERIVPVGCSWQRLLDADGDQLELTYRRILETLAREPGTLGIIFQKAQNKIQDPAKLKRLIADLIDKQNWSAAGVDIKGGAYEELLAKGAEDLKSGAGQYFTPRARVQAMVDCIDPTADDFVACYAPGKPRSKRRETERFKSFAYDELVARDKANLDLIWLRDSSLEDSDNLPAPEVIAREIVEDLEAALAEFAAVAEALAVSRPPGPAVPDSADPA